jgi:hypothetical protein
VTPPPKEATASVRSRFLRLPPQLMSKTDHNRRNPKIPVAKPWHTDIYTAMTTQQRKLSPCDWFRSTLVRGKDRKLTHGRRKTFLSCTHLSRRISNSSSMQSSNPSDLRPSDTKHLT